MKQINKSNLLLISSAILLIATLPLLNFGSFSSALNIGADVLNRVSTGDRHVTRLYELILSDNSVDNGVKINIKDNHLTISNGIVVGDNDSSADGQFSSIGGGIQNKIESSNYAGIAGGTSNKISNGENSVIGGGNRNTIVGDNAVIAGGEQNSASALGVVVGGRNNAGNSNGVALGGQNNNGGSSSLVMGSGASGNHAFSRNAQAVDNAARIDAKSGVLIGTTNTIAGVSLVVSGAVKIAGSGSSTANGIAGEIRVVNGCFYAFDGKYRHVVSQANDPTECTGFASTATCDFGNVRLQQGDQVTGYNSTISTSCAGERVVCSGGILLTVAGNHEGYNSPYCYEITN